MSKGLNFNTLNFSQDAQLSIIGEKDREKVKISIQGKGQGGRLFTIEVSKRAGTKKLFEIIRREGGKNGEVSISGEKMYKILEAAARGEVLGDQDELATVLVKIGEVVAKARTIPGIEDFSRIRAREIEMAKRRALKKAAIIGSGLQAAEEAGEKGRIIKEDYWIEAIDQQHRYTGNPIFGALIDEWKASGSSLDFFTWVDKNSASLPDFDVLTTRVKYCDENERQKYEVRFKGGKAMQNNQPLNTEKMHTYFSGEGYAIFVLSAKDKKFYTASHDVGKFHHSSFLGGGATLAAGEIVTRPDGTIRMLSNKSGHYRPGRNENLALLRTLRAKDPKIDLSKVTFVEISSDFIMHFNAQEYLDSKGAAIPHIIEKNGTARIGKGLDGTVRTVLFETDRTKQRVQARHLHLLKERGVDLSHVRIYYSKNRDKAALFKLAKSKPGRNAENFYRKHFRP